MEFVTNNIIIWPKTREHSSNETLQERYSVWTKPEIWFTHVDFWLKKQWARTFLILSEYQTQVDGVSGYFGKIKPLPPTWSKPFSFIWSVRFYEPLENFFKCSSPEEIFDYMRKKEIERDDLMLCNGDDDDELMMVVVVVLLMM